MAQDTKATLHARLSRIEGQVRGLQRMVDEDRSCIEILTQISATRSALESAALLLLSNHVGQCMTKAVNSGQREEHVRQLTEAIGRIVRS